MKRLDGRIIIAAAVLLLAAIACEFSASTAKVENVQLALDETGESPSVSFGQQDVIYLVGELKNAPDDTKLKTTWLAADVTGAAPETVIDEVELVTGSGTFNFSLEPGGSLWPPGKYRTDLYLNDELSQSFEYEVTQTVQPIVEKLRLAKDAQGNETTLSFQPGDSIFIVGNLLNSPGNSKLKVIWSALSVQGELPLGVIDQQEQVLGSGQFSFENKKDIPSWPPGSYSADVLLDEMLVQTLEYQVQGDSTTGATGLSQVYTARDSDGIDNTNVFAPNETFYVIADLANAPQGAEIEAVWKAEDVPGFEPGEVISEPQVFNFGEGSFSISLANDEGDWPLGKYAVELVVNGVSLDTQNFVVSSIKISESFLAFDQEGTRKTTSFGTGDPFYLMFKLQDAPGDTKISTHWIQLGETAEQDSVVNESDYTFGTGEYFVELTSNSGVWPVGEYAVNILVNDTFYTSINFNVQ